MRHSSRASVIGAFLALVVVLAARQPSPGVVVEKNVAGADARRRRPAGRRVSPGKRRRLSGAAAAHAVLQERPGQPPASSAPSPHAATSSWCRTRAAATRPTASRSRTTRPTTATTRSSGPRRCPYVNGRVGMFGGSYRATTQLRGRDRCGRRTSSRCFPPRRTASRHDMVFQGGAFYLSDGLAWNLGQAMDVRRRVLDAGGRSRRPDRPDARQSAAASTPPGSGTCRSSRSTSWSCDRFAPGYLRCCRHPVVRRVLGDLRHRSAATASSTCRRYHLTGWYDTLLTGTLRNFTGLRAHAGTEHARRYQRLVVGPWTHARPDAEHDEDRRRGLRPERRVRVRDAMMRWFDYWLNGAPTAGRRSRRRAGAAVRDGREPLARRAGVAAGARAQPRRSTCTAAEARTRSTATAGSSRRRRRTERRRSLHLRPGEPGADRRERRLLAHADRSPRQSSSAPTCSSTRRAPLTAPTRSDRAARS